MCCHKTIGVGLKKLPLAVGPKLNRFRTIERATVQISFCSRLVGLNWLLHQLSHPRTAPFVPSAWLATCPDTAIQIPKSPESKSN